MNGITQDSYHSFDKHAHLLASFLVWRKSLQPCAAPVKRSGQLRQKKTAFDPRLVAPWQGSISRDPASDWSYYLQALQLLL